MEELAADEIVFAPPDRIAGVGNRVDALGGHGIDEQDEDISRGDVRSEPDYAPRCRGTAGIAGFADDLMTLMNCRRRTGPMTLAARLGVSSGGRHCEEQRQPKRERQSRERRMENFRRHCPGVYKGARAKRNRACPSPSESVRLERTGVASLESE